MSALKKMRSHLSVLQPTLAGRTGIGFSLPSLRSILRPMSVWYVLYPIYDLFHVAKLACRYDSSSAVLQFFLGSCTPCRISIPTLLVPDSSLVKVRGRPTLSSAFCLPCRSMFREFLICIISFGDQGSTGAFAVSALSRRNSQCSCVIYKPELRGSYRLAAGVAGH